VDTGARKKQTDETAMDKSKINHRRIYLWFSQQGTEPVNVRQRSSSQLAEKLALTGKTLVADTAVCLINF